MEHDGLETRVIGGTDKGRITIAEYNADWPKKFETHAKSIADALGINALRIEHMGSTSVPGLAAKSIIDILVVVPDSSDESAYLPQLEAAGFVLRVREPGWNEHRLFRTPVKDVHVHLYSAGCPEIERCLAFRECLRRSAADRLLYEQTKRELAARKWPDWDAYADAKTTVIEGILAASGRRFSITPAGPFGKVK